MGRVTVFVSNDCTDCQVVRNSFRKYAIPFDEINVDTDPRKRSLMIKLTDRLTTPQVFIHKRHIGGVTAVTTLLTQYDQEAQNTSTIPSPTVLERITGDGLDQSHTMFNIASVERFTNLYETDEFDDRVRTHDLVQITDGVQSTIGDISRDLLQWLPRRNTNRPSLFKSYQCQSSPTYHDYFNGSEAIKTFRKYYHLASSTHAMEFGQKLVTLGIIHRIGTDSLASTLFCGKGYFRLQPLSSPKILNSFRIWTRETTATQQLFPDPIRTVSRLVRRMAEILTAATNGDGIVDYGAARKNGRFRTFEEAVCQLQLVDVTECEERTKKTFFINVYNLMAKHAFVKLCPKKVKRGMFDTVHYNVGGFYFSLEDIYHGILRRNKHPRRQGKMFSISDSRASLSLREEDARIHFALSNSNNANHTTLYEYHVDAIDEELRIIAELYCVSNKRLYINGVQNKVILPKFMETCLSDFTTNGDTHSLLEAILKYSARNQRRFLELTTILERLKTSDDDEKITVLFQNDMIPSRRTERQRKTATLRKIISCVRMFKPDANSISKYYSTIHELATVKVIESPLRSIDFEQSPKRRLSDLTWDCSPELASAKFEAKGEQECSDTDQGNRQEASSTPKLLSSLLDGSNVDDNMDIESTTDTPSYQVNMHSPKLGHQPQMITCPNPDHSVSDESSSYISFDIGSKSFAFSHEDTGSTNKIVWNKSPKHASEHKTNPEYLVHKFPCELTLSDVPNNRSLCTQSTFDLTSSRMDSDTDIENFDITNENKSVAGFDSLYSNANNESTTKASAYKFSNHVHKNSIKPEYDDACALSYLPDGFSIGSKATTSPCTSINERTKPGLDAGSSDIPRINEVNVGQIFGDVDPLYNNVNNTSGCKVPTYIHKPNIEIEHDECTLSYLPDEYSLGTKSTISPTSTKKSIKSGHDNKNSEIPSMNEISAEMSTTFDSLFVL
eukprot:CAMPEP_0198278658 /NCGR_PEP_ID=MMETSP1447-20131203/66492_1 /TAXON_ID=420782 /ORGANISM="Chaetoceros dichaeta, Strain CCMP1751" /LENGTH=956 /DNA_ID=CAMNT_0043973749 /DNA_START=89 /DNA_END=2959 /DNA_ORIENTATION=+